MSKRSFRTPLYELITARRDRGEASEEAAPAPAAPGPSWLAAGRTVRLPVGYLLARGGGPAGPFR